MLAYGTLADQLDEVLKIATSTCLEIFGKICRRSDWKNRWRISTPSKKRWTRKKSYKKWGSWFSMNIQKHWLYALSMEELFERSLDRHVHTWWQRCSNYDPWSSGNLGSSYMSCFLWYRRVSEQHRHSKQVTTIHSSNKRGSSCGTLWRKTNTRHGLLSCR